jgi:predicted ATPase/DNA-binding CsgD family transcriptional regulator/Tfp pilus assembly protein PilF
MDHITQQSLDALTEREREVLRLLATGMSDGEIAEALVLTVGTVKWYNRQIYSKLGVRNRTEAVTQAQQSGMLPGGESSAVPMPLPEHNLPAQITSFVGRGGELGEIKRLLRASRLVTLTGPPGTGKTRLALAAAREVLTDFADGVSFVPLAPVREARHVLSTIAQTLQIQETGGETLIAAMNSHLRDKETLLVLDNFEHVLEVAPLVSDLLAAAQGLRVLVTSREALRLYGEHEYPVPPLRLPDLTEPVSLSALHHYEAVDLFVQRARSTAPGFALSEDNAAATTAICVHLDGLPLAIELAAVRVKFYPPETLLLRLGSRLEALGEGPRDLPARQRTLRATLAWSYDLLSGEEQTLFARLGVFAGGCTLADAEAVCSDDSLNVAQGLESLVGKSLLYQEQTAGGEPRFVMLETMREYALEKLEERGETEAIRQRHGEYYLAMGEKADQALYGPEESRWINWMVAQHDNIRGAIRWSLTFDQSGQTSLRLIGCTAQMWRWYDHYREGRAWFAEAEELPGAAAPTMARAYALYGVAYLCYLQSDYTTTRTLAEEALGIYEAARDRKRVADVLMLLGEIATEVGDYDNAPLLFEKAYDIMREVGDSIDQAKALNQLGFGALRAGDLDQAQAWLEESVALYDQTPNVHSSSLGLSGLGEIAIRHGKLDAATKLLERSLVLRRSVGQKWGTAASLGSLAWVAMLQNDFARAVEILRESLLIRMEIQDRGGMAWCLEKLAAMARQQGEHSRAARLYGGAAGLRASVNSVVDPVDQAAHEAALDEVRAALGDAVYEALWAEGQGMGVDGLITYSLGSGE